MMGDQIGWDEHGNLYLPERYAHIGVAMDRRDAAEECQRAFDGARLGHAQVCACNAVDGEDRRCETHGSDL